MKVTESNALYSLTREGKAQADWETRGEAGVGGILQVFQNAFSFVFPPSLPYSRESVLITRGSRHQRSCIETRDVVFIIIKGNRHFLQCKNSICDLLWRDCYQYTSLFLSASRAKAHSFIEVLTRNVRQTFFSSGDMCIHCVFSSEEKFLFFFLLRDHSFSGIISGSLKTKMVPLEDHAHAVLLLYPGRDFIFYSWVEFERMLATEMSTVCCSQLYRLSPGFC